MGRLNQRFPSITDSKATHIEYNEPSLLSTFYNSETLKVSDDQTITFTTMPALSYETNDTFVEWNTRYNGSGVALPPDTVVTMDVSNYYYESGEYTGYGTIVLYPIFEDPIVPYDDRGEALFCDETGMGYDGWILEVERLTGTHNVSNDLYTFDEKVEITIPEEYCPPEKDGYVFKGWSWFDYENLKFGELIYQPGDTVAFTNHASMLFKAVFESKFTVENQSDSINVDVAIPSDDIRLEGDVPIDSVKLLVNPIGKSQLEPVLEAVKSANPEFSTDKFKYKAADMSIVDENGNEVGITQGKMKIKLKYPDSKDCDYVLYHYKEGKAQKVAIEKQDDGIVFYADSFSPYVLVWKNSSGSSADDSADDTSNNSSTQTPGNQSDKNSPSTGENFDPTIFILLTIISASMIFAMMKNRKKQEI